MDVPRVVGDNEFCVGEATTVRDAKQQMHLVFWLVLLESLSFSSVPLHKRHLQIQAALAWHCLFSSSILFSARMPRNFFCLHGVLNKIYL
jgi:hypothetical protein